MQSSAQRLEAILAIEVAGARLEGIFLADPELGRIWRAQASLTEACRSVSLEDLPVKERDVATRPLIRGASTEGIARGIWSADELLKVMLSPGDAQSDMERAVRRAMRAGVRPEGTEEIIGEGDDAIYRAVAAALASAPAPLVGALRASLTLRMNTGSISPSAERLLFMICDHAMRGGRAGREIADPLPEGLGLGAAIGAPAWIFLPSTGLTTDGFKIWSPGSATGLDHLLTGLEREVSRAVGVVPILRRWRQEARSLAESKRGDARTMDVIRLLVDQPILTAAMVSTALGMTQRRALNILNEVAELGLAGELTYRRSHRAWAIGPLAQRLRGTSPKAALPRRKPMDTEDCHEEASAFQHEQPEEHARIEDHDRSGEERALAELDAAMSIIDAVLAKYKK